MHTRETVNLRYSNAFATDVVTAYSVNPAAALIVAPKVRLFQGDTFHPSPSTPKADFDAAQATFTDYTEKTLTLATPVGIGTPGKATGGVVQWNMTTDPTVTQNTVRGYYVVDGAELIAFEEWAEGDDVGMAAPGDLLILEVILPFLTSQPVPGA